MSLTQVNVAGLPSASLSDSTQPTMLGGKSGEGIVAELHGGYYTAAYRGNVFSATVSHGSLLLAPGGTTSGLALWNPAGSGVNMELIEFSAVPTTATDVVGAISFEYGIQTPTSGTSATVVNMLLGQGVTPKGKCAWGNTITAMSLLLSMFTVQTTAGVLQGLPVYRPGGALILAPGSAINCVSTASQSTNVWNVTYIWAEFPV